jgi:hypothetical protein
MTRSYCRLITNLSGESIAHLNCLIRRGQVVRQLDDAGVVWYRSIDLHAPSMDKPTRVAFPSCPIQNTNGKVAGRIIVSVGDMLN